MLEDASRKIKDGIKGYDDDIENKNAKILEVKHKLSDRDLPDLTEDLKYYQAKLLNVKEMKDLKIKSMISDLGRELTRFW